MQSLQVGPGAAAQRDVETAHAQLRCPLSQSVAMGEDRIVFAKIDTGKNAERGFDFRNGATGVRGEICECCSLGALGQAEQQLQSQFGEQAIGLAVQTSPLKRLLNWQTISAVAGTGVEHNLFTNRDNWLETMHVKSSCQLEFAREIRLTRTVYLPIFRVALFDRQWLHLRADRAWCQRGSGQSARRLFLAEPDTRRALGGTDGRIVPAQRSQR